MSRTDPATVWATGAAVAKGDVIEWAGEVDARLAFQTATELEAATIQGAGSDVQAVLLLAWAAAGDLPQPVVLQWVAAAPDDGVWVESADGAIWAFRGASACPEFFGAVGDGATDDIAALDATLALAVALKAPVRLRQGAVYGVSRPWDIVERGVVIETSGGRNETGISAENRAVTKFVALAGFSATSGVSAVIRVGALRSYSWPATSFSGDWDAQGYSQNSEQVGLYLGGGILIDCNDVADYGLALLNTSQAEVRGVCATNGAAGGLLFDGVWQTNIYNCVAKWCDGPGILLGHTNRKITNSLLADCQSSVNNGPQLLLEVPDTAENIRVGHDTLEIRKCLFESPEDTSTGSRVSVDEHIVRIEGAQNVEMHACTINQTAGNNSACLRFGKVGANKNPIRRFAMFGGKLQHSTDATKAAVSFVQPVKNLEFYGTMLLLNDSRAVDTTNLGAVSGVVPQVMFAGNYDEYVVKTVQDGLSPYVRFFNPGVIQAQRFVSGNPFVGTETQWNLGVYDTATNDRNPLLSLGAGPDLDRVLVPAGALLALEPMTGAEIAALTPAVGALAMWDGTGTAPDGASVGETMFVRKTGAWVAVA